MIEPNRSKIVKRYNKLEFKKSIHTHQQMLTISVTTIYIPKLAKIFNQLYVMSLQNHYHCHHVEDDYLSWLTVI